MVWKDALAKLHELESNRPMTSGEAGRQHSFRVLRELHVALLETGALSDLLSVGASGKQTNIVASSVNDLFER